MLYVLNLLWLFTCPYLSGYHEVPEQSRVAISPIRQIADHSTITGPIILPDKPAVDEKASYFKNESYNENSASVMQNVIMYYLTTEFWSATVVVVGLTSGTLLFLIGFYCISKVSYPFTATCVFCAKTVYETEGSYCWIMQ